MSGIDPTDDTHVEERPGAVAVTSELGLRSDTMGESPPSGADDLEANFGLDELNAALFDTPRRFERIGHYEILGTIGSGGMGLVLRARDEKLGRTIALKIVHTLHDGSDAARARMLREAQAMARVSHPNVVGVHDVGVHEGRVYVAMEYVRGQTMRDWMDDLGPPQTRSYRDILERFVEAGRGLAAAHAAKLVHRDFKPENVLIGDDGRVRVTDFGLVSLATHDGKMDEATASRSMQGTALVDLVTRIGTVMGTVAYMSPEQLDGASVDPRSDQFSFCVALYEALYGVRPFKATTAASLYKAMRRGPQAEPTGESVPAWLRAVILPGLAVDPGERYPSMEALLGALSTDPMVARRRVLRALGLIALTALLVAAALLGIQSAMERWATNQREDAAALRIAELEQRAADLREEGEDGRAVRLLDESLDDRMLEGTYALAMAWTREADRRSALRQRETGQSALSVALDGSLLRARARAYTTAQDDRQRAEAILALGETLRLQRRWEPLSRLLDRIAREQPEVFNAYALAQIRFDVALVRLDVEGAREADMKYGLLSPEARAVLDTLRTARRTPFGGAKPAVNAKVGLGAEGPDSIVIQRPDAQGIEMLLLDRRLSDEPLAKIRPELLGGTILVTVPSVQGTTPLLVGTEPDGATNVLLALDERGGLETLLQWEGASVAGAAAADLDGDGSLELYVGELAPKHSITQLSRELTGEWRARTVATAALTMGSDVTSLTAGDFDGDGNVELAAAFGPWSAYDVRILDLDENLGELRTLARRKVGMSTTFSLRRPRGRTSLLVTKWDQYANTTVFPRDRLFGEPEGLYIMDFDGASLSAQMLRPGHFRSMVEDLNGDGLDDVIVSHDEQAILLIQGADGGFSELNVGLRWPVSALNVDDDPEPELVFDVLARGVAGEPQGYELWVAGDGEESLPVRPIRALAVGDEVPSSSSFGARVASIETLAEIGLLEEAASSYAREGESSGDASEQALAQLRGAQLYEAVGREDLATPLYLSAATGTSRVAEAVEGALRGSLDRVQRHELLAAVDLALTKTGDDVARGRLEASRRELATILGETAPTLQVDRPLSAEWSIDDPNTVLWSAAQSALNVEAYKPTQLLSRRLSYDGGQLSVELDLALDRVEWSTGIQLQLLPVDGGHRVLMLRVVGLGGGGVVDVCFELEIASVGRGWCEPTRGAAITAGERPRFVLRGALFPRTGKGHLSVRESDETRSAYTVPVPEHALPEGDYRLIIETVGVDTAGAAASIYGLRTTGLQSGGQEEASRAASPRAAMIRALTNADLDRANALLRSYPAKTPSERAEKVEILLRLGHLDDARRLLGELLSTSSPGEMPAQLLCGLRRRPESYGLLVMSLDEHRYFRLVYDAWALSRAMHAEDPRVDEAVMLALGNLDPYIDWIEGDREGDGHPELEDVKVGIELVSWRAAIRRRRRDYARALVDLETALRLTELKNDDSAAQRQLHERRPWLELKMATLMVEDGDDAGAEALLRRALEGAVALHRSVLYDDIIAARPELEALARRMRE